MGNCCFKGGSAPEEDVEISVVQNDLVRCRMGACAPTIKVKSVQGVQGAMSAFAVEGSGTALGSCPIDCDTGYFEVKLGGAASSDNIKVGVKRYNAKKNVDLTGQLDSSNESFPGFCFSSHKTVLKAGDVIGVHWDQTDLPMLSFTVNGVEVPEAAINRIRPSNEIFPSVSLSAGSECTIYFDEKDFSFKPRASKFKMIVCATSLI